MTVKTNNMNYKKTETKIIEATKEFAEVNNIHYDDLTESLIVNALRELLYGLDYWKQRCELAEKCIEESPCDPDITNDQIKAHNAYNKFISNYGNDR